MSISIYFDLQKRVSFLFVSFLLFAFSANAHEGGMTSSGGELVSHEHNPWFIGAAPVTYCIERANDFSVSELSVRERVREALDEWVQTLSKIGTYSTKQALPDGERKTLSVNFREQTTCVGAELQFRLGTLDDEVKATLAQHAKMTFAYAKPLSYNKQNGRWSGYVWFAPDQHLQSFFPKGVVRSWNFESAFKNMLLHELGHVFGLNHFYGSVMNADYPAFIFEGWAGFRDADLSHLVDRNWFIREGAEICFESDDDGMGGQYSFWPAIKRSFSLSAYLVRARLCFKCMVWNTREAVISIELRKKNDNSVIEGFDLKIKSSDWLPRPSAVESAGRYSADSSIQSVETFFFVVQKFSYLGNLTHRKSGSSLPATFTYDAESSSQLNVQILSPLGTANGDIPHLLNRDFYPRNGFIELVPPQDTN